MSDRISYVEAAEILGVHFSAVAKMRRRGELTTERRRGAALDRAEVEALAERRRADREELAARAGKRRSVDSRPDAEHDWLRATEVAAMFGISAQAVRQSLRRGSLPGTWSHGKWWVRADHVELALNARYGRRR